MKNLKFKILLTNISRVVRSILFINLSNIVLGMNKVFGAIDPTPIKTIEEVSCYSIQIDPKYRILNFLEENIFVLIVPIVLIIITIIFARRKIKEKKITEEAQKRMEEKNDKQD